MAKNDFSRVRPATTAGTAPSRQSDTDASWWSTLSPGRRRVYVVAGLGVMVIVIAVVAKLIAGAGTDQRTASAPPSFGAVHGPAVFSHGIPSGYTHDRGGAATAATDFVQVLSRVKPGQVDALQSALIGPSPSPALTAQLEAARKPQTGTERSDVLNAIPATVSVHSLTSQVAQVSVWTMTSDNFVLNAAGETSLQLLWSTTDLKLVWAQGDWKVVDYRYRTGPDPSDASAPTSGGPGVEPGYFSFFVN